MSFINTFKDKIKSQLNDSQNRLIIIVSDDVQKERMDTCVSCEHFFKITRQCKKCACFMDIKTTLQNAQCPLNKWPVDDS